MTSTTYQGKIFKIGDRVTTKSYPELFKEIGTIVGFEQISRTIIVKIDWDNLKNGHSCGGLARPGHGWNLALREVILIQTEPNFHEE